MAVTPLGIRSAHPVRPAPILAEPSTRTAPLPQADELFRGIYTRAALGFASEIVAVTSATVGEGKTTVSLGIATAIALDFPERRVLLVETELQRPVLAQDFGITHTPGLVEALRGDEYITAVCHPTFLENLDILPAGDAGHQVGRPLRSSRMIEALETLRQQYHLIVLDTPPVLTNSDALLLTDLADAILFVVRVGGAPAACVNKALEQVEEAKLRGIVMNGSSTWIPGWLRNLLGVSTAAGG